MLFNKGKCIIADTVTISVRRRLIRMHGRCLQCHHFINVNKSFSLVNVFRTEDFVLYSFSGM